MERLKGIVKWFNDGKGYGFIVSPSVEGDVIVHHTEIIMEGFRTLSTGQHVEFSLKAGDKGQQAGGVTAVEPEVVQTCPECGHTWDDAVKDKAK